jgi:hypothetical protein
MELSRFFEKYRPQKDWNLIPSEMLPLEIERWETYKKLITKRSRKYLKKDKTELQKFLIGNTFPLGEVYENNPDRVIELNPLFDKETKTFPLWEKIKIAVDSIGIDSGPEKEIPTVKTAINEALRAMIEKLKSLDVQELDAEVAQFDYRLEKARKDAVRQAISKKVKLPYYPKPRDAYVARERHYLDYNQICIDNKQTKLKIDWTLKYTRALIHEVAEYYDESDDHKAKIELIDILFFLVSVLQVAGWDASVFEQIMSKNHVPFDPEVDYHENMVFSAIDIENSIAWKHWKSYSFGIHPGEFHSAIEAFVEDWKEHTYVEYGMTSKQVHQAFLDKLGVNHARQDDGYTKKKKDDDIHVRTK